MSTAKRSLRMGLCLVGLSTIALVALQPLGIAAPSASNVLDSPQTVVTWPGEVASSERQEFQLVVNLPPPLLRRGRVQVLLHTPYEDELQEQDQTDRDAERQNVDLQVLDNAGALVASSAGGDEDTESVYLPSAANGAWTIVAIGDETPGLEYVGRAEFEPLKNAGPAKDLLPDLVVLPQRNVTFGDTRLSYPYPTTQFVDGCLAEERIEDGAQRCLRFDQNIANFGAGPMELRYSLRDVGDKAMMYQRILRSDGTVTEREASSYEFHPTHTHFHYEAFAVSRLWAADSDGTRKGPAPVATGDKNGFCLMDVIDAWWDRKGDAPRGYYGTDCIKPEALTGADLFLGISVGWGDLYNWHLPDQYIEASDVADGYYVLETIADPNDTIVETNESNNITEALVRINGDEVEIVAASDEGRPLRP